MIDKPRSFGSDSDLEVSVGRQLIEGFAEFANSLEGGEDISDRFAFHRVTLKLEPTPYTGEMVKETRRLLQSSQKVFAVFLGISERTVRSWEQDVNKPNAMASRFMDAIRSDPSYWRAQLTKIVQFEKKGPRATKRQKPSIV